MLVDKDPFPNTMPVNMLTPKFQLVLDMSSEEPKQASAFNRLRKFQGHGSPSKDMDLLRVQYFVLAATLNYKGVNGASKPLMLLQGFRSEATVPQLPA